MPGISSRPGIIGGKQPRIAEAIIHGPQIGGPCQDVVARIMRIMPQTMLCPHGGPGRGHQLHQAHRPGPADDEAAVPMSLAPAFRPHDGYYPILGDTEPQGRLRNEGAPAIDRRGRNRLVDILMRPCSRVQHFHRQERRREPVQRSHNGVAFPMIASLPC